MGPIDEATVYAVRVSPPPFRCAQGRGTSTGAKDDKLLARNWRSTMLCKYLTIGTAVGCCSRVCLIFVGAFRPPMGGWPKSFASRR
jgi:hypothetical protein